MATKKPKLVAKKTGKSIGSPDISVHQDDINPFKELSNSKIERIDLSVIPFESQSFRKTYYRAASLEKLISKKKLELSYEQEDNYHPEDKLFAKYVRTQPNVSAAYCFDVLFINRTENQRFTVTNKPNYLFTEGVSRSVNFGDIALESVYIPVMPGDEEKSTYTEHRFSSNYLCLDDVLMLLNRSVSDINNNEIKNKLDKESYDRYRKWIEYAEQPFKRIMTNQTKRIPSILNRFLSKFVDKKLLFQLFAEMKELAMDESKKFELMSYDNGYQPSIADPLKFLFAAIYKELNKISSREDNLMNVDLSLKRKGGLRIYKHERNVPINYYRHTKNYLKHLKNLRVRDAGIPRKFIDSQIKKREEELKPFNKIFEYGSPKSMIEILEENTSNRLDKIFSNKYWSENKRPRVFGKENDEWKQIKNVLIQDDPKTVKKWKKILTEDAQ